MGSRELGERLVADAYEAGISGLEERGGAVTELLLYAPLEKAASVRQALEAWCQHGVRIGEPRVVAEVDWAEAWREGLTTTVISPRLAVRPSWLAHPR